MANAKYSRTNSPTAIETTMATVLSTAKKNITSPVRNKNKERWRSVTVIATWGSRLHLGAHCCLNVANRAEAMLSTRLISHRMLTQISEAAGGDVEQAGSESTVSLATPVSPFET